MVFVPLCTNSPIVSECEYISESEVFPRFPAFVFAGLIDEPRSEDQLRLSTCSSVSAQGASFSRLDVLHHDHVSVGFYVANLVDG